LTPKPQADYGPSLPELLRPRLRALARWQRAALLGLGVFVLVAIAARVIHVEAQKRTYTQSAGDARARGLEPITFHFDHSRKLRIFKPPGDYVQAEWKVKGTLAASFSVAPFEIEGQSGLLSGFMPILATELERKAARTYDHFRLQFEGRSRVNDVEGYQYAFAARLLQAGKTPRQLFGRVVMLPEPYDTSDPSKEYPPGQVPARGLKLTMLSTSLDNVPSATRVGDEGILKRPFRSFRFGT
jgi:hypothetical protein